MGNVIAIASSIVADALRRKVVYVVLLFAALMAVAIPILPSYGVGVVGSVFREVALALTYASALVVTLSLAANRIPGEVERRTVYNVLVKRVRRGEYVIGTWAGVAIVMAGVIACFTAVNQIIGWFQYSAPMWVLWQGALGIWMEMAVLAAFAVLVSTRIGPVPVVAAALLFVFVGHARSGLFPDGASLGARLYPSLDTFNVIAPVAHGGGVSVAYIGVMVAALAAWVAVLMFIAVAAFEGRDL